MKKVITYHELQLKWEDVPEEDLPDFPLMDVDWTDLMLEEPKLRSLWGKVLLYQRVEPQRDFCRKAVWYDRFKPKLLEIIGWGRPGKKATWLHGEQAYDLAYSVISETLPACQHKGECFG